MNQNTYTNFKHLLVDPYTKENLVYKNNSFQSKSNNYLIKQNVCVFLKNDNDKDSDFKYIEHYKKDGEEFDYSAVDYPKTTIYEIKKLQESIIAEVKSKKDITILDVGCGNGWVAKEFVNKGYNVISLDISFDNTKRIISQIPDNNHMAIIADAFHLPIKENSIDYIIASEIMEHVVSPKKFMEALYKILNTNGKLIISTPYDEVIEHFLCIHCNKKTPKYAHLHSFNEKNIINHIPYNITYYKSKIINNVMLVKLSIHRFLDFLPLKLWLIIDRFARVFYKKYYRFILIITKK